MCNLDIEREGPALLILHEPIVVTTPCNTECCDHYGNQPIDVRATKRFALNAENAAD